MKRRGRRTPAFNLPRPGTLPYRGSVTVPRERYRTAGALPYSGSYSARWFRFPNRFQFRLTALFGEDRLQTADKLLGKMQLFAIFADSGHPDIDKFPAEQLIGRQSQQRVEFFGS